MSKSKVLIARLYDKLKAGIVDMFMIMMPIQYFTTYILVGSAVEYRQNQSYIFLATFLYLIIILLFLFFKGQTPGYKHQKLHLRNKNGKRASFSQICIRMIIFIITFAFLFGIIFPFFRKDRQYIHDLFSNTIVLKENINE